ncbi:hypothetical protein C8Q75DRAFT_803606 [Abortiporus biennis]|nr:hypothetical protein C8Q75DRAFT_803606 [Abortiporus biennis]
MSTLIGTGSSWRATPLALSPHIFLSSLLAASTYHPIPSLFKAIECERWSLKAPPHIPENDLCDTLPVLESKELDILIYWSLVVSCSVLVSRVWGRLSDSKGRKWVLFAVGLIGLVGDLGVCAAGIVKGLGGSIYTIQSTQLAFIADATSYPGLSYITTNPKYTPLTRSKRFGSLIVLSFVAYPFASFISEYLKESQTLQFVLVVLGCWGLYFAYLKWVLVENRSFTSTREEVEVEEAEEEPEMKARPRTRRWTLFWTLLVLGIWMLCASSMGLLGEFSEPLTGVSPASLEVSLLDAGLFITGILSIKYLLPLFNTVFRYLFKPSFMSTTPMRSPRQITERTPLLSTTGNVGTSNNGVSSSPSPSPIPVYLESEENVRRMETSLAISQDLTLSRFALILSVIGLVKLFLSRDFDSITYASAVYALGAPFLPSMLSLITFLASTPRKNQYGLVLSNFAIFNSLFSVGVPGKSLLARIFEALVDVQMEGAGAIVWLTCSVITSLSLLILVCLRKERFIFSGITPALPIRIPNEQQTNSPRAVNQDVISIHVQSPTTPT